MHEAEQRKNWVPLYSRLLNTLLFQLLFSNKPHTRELHMLELHTTLYNGVYQLINILTSCTKSTLPAHHQCLSLAPPTVTHSPPEPSHTDLHSALTLPLSTNKTKISRAALRLGGGVSLTDNTGYWGRTIAG